MMSMPVFAVDEPVSARVVLGPPPRRLVAAAEGETFTTIELKISFLGAVRKATLTAEARVGKRAALWDRLSAK